MKDERQPNEHPVEELAAGRLAVGSGMLPVALTHDWDAPLPGVAAALVVLHGRLRNAGDYLRSGREAVAGRPAWLVVAPQFPAEVDIVAHGAAPETLRWELTGWMGGGTGLGRHGVSAFAALDAVLARLAALPDMRRVVVAGHSGGGQVVQRYAMLGRPGAGAAGPQVRYLVANPSSYAFPDAWRPGPACPGQDDWKYGLQRLPPHGGSLDRAGLLDRYAARDVTYLLGEHDTDPCHPALDTSPAALAQGPHRRARGEAFFHALLRCRPGCRHALRVVPGAGHDGQAMMTSSEAAAALFA